MLRDTLKTLLAAYGPSGKENTVAETVKSLISAHVDSMRTDALGNLIVEKLGSDENGKRIMFSAHMDHIGFVVTHIEDTGYLRVNNVGGINPTISNARHVVFENGTEGVLYCQPLKGEQMAMKHLFVDIGAESREEAEKCVQLGDMVLSVEKAVEQGYEFGHGIKREIGYLTVHSMLHLLGYDHLDEGPMKRQMRRQEEAIMAQLMLRR